MTASSCCVGGRIHVRSAPGWQLNLNVGPRTSRGSRGNFWETVRMSGPRLERILASTALALILAAPIGASAMAQEAVAPSATAATPSQAAAAAGAAAAQQPAAEGAPSATAATPSQ